jgi:hypothetical protein
MSGRQDVYRGKKSSIAMAEDLDNAADTGMCRRTFLALAVASVFTQPLAIEAEPISPIIRDRRRIRHAMPFDTKFQEWVNIKEFGAVGNGVTDDTAAIEAFTKAYQGKSVAVMFPPGTYLWGSQNFVDQTIAAFNGINEIWIYAYGASFANDGAGLLFGTSPSRSGSGRAFVANSTAFVYAPIQTAIQPDGGGQSLLVTLVTPSDASKFVIGDWVQLSALDVQDHDVNAQYYEFAQITNINSMSGVVTLDRYYNNPYVAGYPQYFTGGVQHQPGPATMYRMYPGWGMKFHVYGLTTPFISTWARFFEFVDCHFTTGFVPQANQYMVCRNCTFDTECEIDKCVTFLKFENCFFAADPLIQSPSPDFYVLDGCICAQGIAGTAKNTIVRNCVAPALTMGPRTFGHGETLLIENSRINKLATWGNFAQEHLSHYTFSNGTFSKPLANGPAFWASEGGLMYFWDSVSQKFTPGPFFVTGIRADANNTYIDTTLGPNAVANTAGDSVVAAGVNKLTVINSSGCDALVDLSQAPRGKPWGVYSKRLWMGNGSYCSFGDPLSIATYGGGNGANLPVIGYFVSVTVNVIRAYTGSQSGVLWTTLTGVLYDSSQAALTYHFDVDVTLTGTRTAIIGSTTGTQGADNISTFAAGTFFGKLGGGFLNKDVSAEAIYKWPIIEVEVKTDHTIGQV